MTHFIRQSIRMIRNLLYVQKAIVALSFWISMAPRERRLFVDRNGGNPWPAGYSKLCPAKQKSQLRRQLIGSELRFGVFSMQSRVFGERSISTERSYMHNTKYSSISVVSVFSFFFALLLRAILH